MAWQTTSKLAGAEKHAQAEVFEDTVTTGEGVRRTTRLREAPSSSVERRLAGVWDTSPACTIVSQLTPHRNQPT
eukprot:2217154-Rhodomonas_salina.1